MKVGEQCLYLAQMKGLSKAEAKKQLEYWFERLEIQGWWNKKIQELSKGMAQGERQDAGAGVGAYRHDARPTVEDRTRPRRIPSIRTLQSQHRDPSPPRHRDPGRPGASSRCTCRRQDPGRDQGDRHTVLAGQFEVLLDLAPVGQLLFLAELAQVDLIDVGTARPRGMLHGAGLGVHGDRAE